MSSNTAFIMNDFFRLYLFGDFENGYFENLLKKFQEIVSLDSSRDLSFGVSKKLKDAVDILKQVNQYFLM